ncbi:MAG: aminotransferase class I/II-fold pyridoxal phosphate-dependent enzyme [Filifactor alocis]|nr:aminotransferase class I/II-fold pyridoxal phosphate-dependent enzyme [Filifactor alocis]
MREKGHGADLVGVARKYGMDKESLKDFSANVNIFRSEKIREYMEDFDIEDLFHYPDIHHTALRRIFALRYEVDEEEVVVGNGATELIYLVVRDPRFQRIGVWQPSFTEYERAINSCGKEAIPLYYDENFDLDERCFSTLEDLDLVFICNPNNPNGRLKRIEDFAKLCEDKGVALCVDETFIEFSYREEEYSLLPLIRKHPNLMVLRALTKFYSLAGLRLGYLFTSRDNASSLACLQEPWTVNALASKLAPVVFDRDFIARSKEFYRTETEFVYEKLSQIEGLKVYPTDVNFILFELEKMSAASLKEDLLVNHRLLIRDCSNYRGLGDGFVRVNIKDRRRNEELISALCTEVMKRSCGRDLI